MSNLILGIKEREEELREKEEVLNNLTDGLAKFNERVGGRQDFTQTEMRNLTRVYVSGLFYNNRWSSDGELIIVETNCDIRIKPSRVEKRIVRKRERGYINGRFTDINDTNVENRYFYNINELKTILKNKVENARKNLEYAKQDAFNEMKELQKYFSKNGSPDGDKENK